MTDERRDEVADSSSSPRRNQISDEKLQELIEDSERRGYKFTVQTLRDIRDKRRAHQGRRESRPL